MIRRLKREDRAVLSYLGSLFDHCSACLGLAVAHKIDGSRQLMVKDKTFINIRSLDAPIKFISRVALAVQFGGEGTFTSTFKSSLHESEARGNRLTPGSTSCSIMSKMRRGIMQGGWMRSPFAFRIARRSYLGRHHGVRV
jgi:hypothetical protein